MLEIDDRPTTEPRLSNTSLQSSVTAAREPLKLVSLGSNPSSATLPVSYNGYYAALVTQLCGFDSHGGLRFCVVAGL